MSAAYRLLAATAAASALVAGCAHSPVGPDYAAPASLSAAQAASAATFQSAGGYAAETTLPPHWWRLYNDWQLEALVTQALEHNTDLRQAVANLERDKALEAEVLGNERPTLAASGGPGFGHVSGLSLLQSDYEPPSRGTYSAGVSLSYQLDLFDQLRRAIEAAEAGTGAAQAAATRVAAARFDGTVLTALREVETALDIYTHELERHSALSAARDQSAAVARQARILYVNGKTGQLEALDAERTLAASEGALAASAARLAEDQVAVFMAVGGGWELTTP